MKLLSKYISTVVTNVATLKSKWDYMIVHNNQYVMDYRDLLLRVKRELNPQKEFD